MVESVNEWYSNFLTRRPVPLKREPLTYSASESYAVHISKVHLVKPQQGAQYRISVHFFDLRTGQVFGWPFHSPWQRAHHNICHFDEVFFFHSVRIDDSIHLIVEVVEDANDDLIPRCIAWTTIPIDEPNTTLPDYTRLPVEIQPNRICLHPGTPKVLTFTTTISPDVASMGTIEFLLATHEKLRPLHDFFPEFCIVSVRERVPGADLLKLRPHKLLHSSLHDICIHMGSAASKIEKLLLEHTNTDRINRENLIGAVNQQQMIVVERRLRIGVHNTFTFLFEPIVVHLSSNEETSLTTHSLRRKSRFLTRSTTDLTSDAQNLNVRTSVDIPKLFDDKGIVVVFALDYLLGVKSNQNSIQTSTQSVIVSWGAWDPFENKAALSQGAIRGTVSLIGGPRPNPDESFCFKNLLNITRADDSIFTESEPKISIDFVFSLIDMDSAPPSSRLPEGNVITPIPTKEPVRETKPGKESPLPSTPREKPSKPQVKKPSEFPPLIPQKPVYVQSTTNEQISRIVEAVDTPREDLPFNYNLPWKASRATNVGRSVYAVLSEAKLERIPGKKGPMPPIVDATNKIDTNLNIEFNDRLTTNEIYIQLLAFRQINYDCPDISKLFFSFQFYRFPEIVTEELYLSPSKSKADPCILKRNVDGAETAGFMARFLVDRQGTKFGARNEFFDYLQNQYLFLEVWNSVSLILVGTVMIPLWPLLRNGNESVQSIIQCPVIFSALPDSGTINGMLYLRIANIGNFTNIRTDELARSITPRTGRMIDDQEGAHSYRILAKPLNSLHETAVHRFIQAQRIDVQNRYEEFFNKQSRENIEKWEKLKPGVPRELQTTAFKQFMFEEQLEAYRTMRKESKAAKLLHAVFRGITTSYSIYPCPGERIFFEFLLQNTFTDPINCIIDFSDLGLSIVDNVEEWSFYKKISSIKTPIEESMCRRINQTRAEIFLMPMEAVHIPFLYDDTKSETHEDSYKDTKVIFRRWDNGEPLAILDLHIENRPVAVNRLFRFYTSHLTQCSRHIEIDMLPRDIRIAAVRCNDASVKLSVRNLGAQQKLAFSVFSGESYNVKHFLVMLYADIYEYRLIETWKIGVHSLERIDVRTTFGQTARVNLSFTRAEQMNELMEVNCNSRSIECPSPALITQQLAHFNTMFRPHTTGKQQVIATTVEPSTKKLLHGWLLCTRAEAPVVTKTFEMTVDHGEVLQKSIPVTSSYNIPIRYKITCSRPDLISPAFEEITVEPQRSVPAQLIFHGVVKDRATVPIYLFISNAETGATEETILLRVTYEPSSARDRDH